MNKSSILAYTAEIKQRLVNLKNSEGKRVLQQGTPTFGREWDRQEMDELELATTSVMLSCYGAEHTIVLHYLEKLKERSDSWHLLTPFFYGQIESIENQFRHGLFDNLESQISSEIFGNFVLLSKEVLSSSKDVAAVLVCAALEDALKKLGSLKGLDVHDKDMSEVVNALKRSGILKGAQSTLINSYVTMRNRAFHAQWDKIEATDVSSAIAFTERLLLENFK